MTAACERPPAHVHDETIFETGRALDAFAQHWQLLVLTPLACATLAFGGSFLWTPIYKASASILPPQQAGASSAAMSALSALGPLASLAGGAGVRAPADQYVALMQSRVIADEIIRQFDLMTVYEAELLTDARDRLRERTRIRYDKKDNLIFIDVEDADPHRAAKIVNRHVDELRRLTDRLSISEAQQRRAFFEKHLRETRDRMELAQRALQSSGFSQGALRTEPKMAAETYAQLKAELVAAEIKLEVLSRSLAEGAPEVSQQKSLVASLASRLQQAERSTPARTNNRANEPDYVSKYREFKYQEALFDLYARQFELARVDESRDGSLIQVVDPATPPQRASRPRRLVIAAMSALISLALTAVVLVWRQARRDATLRSI